MISNVSAKTEAFSASVNGCAVCNKIVYSSADSNSSPDIQNRILAELSIDSLVKEYVAPEAQEKCLKEDFYFYGGGWQSWGFGGELEPGSYLKPYIPVISQWLQYVTFPGKAPVKVLGKKPSSRRLLNGEFIIYLRWENTYLAVCSSARANDEILPPLKFYVDRKSRRIAVTAYSDGKKWAQGEKIAELTVFAADGFFALRDMIKAVYGDTSDSRFDSLRFLSSEKDSIKTCGWESWYNHYANINQKLIDGDLNSLDKTGNIIKTFCLDKKKPTVFQVDDGWEQALGQWNVWEERFPEGMTNLASSIAAKGYIPGLWIAPFIIDWRADAAREHRDWILRDETGHPIAAGYGELWGAKNGPDQPDKKHSYFCLDLSRDDVLEYLDGLMDKIINVWGFRYIKLDFLFAGMIYGAYKNGGAGYEWYDKAIKLITKRKQNNKGEGVAYLGCGCPLEASYTALPLSRIGPDTKEAWDFDILAKLRWHGRPGALPNMQSTLGHAFWDQSVFINDPDVIFLRYANITLTDTEKELVALVNFMFASQLMHSDDPVDFDENTDGKLTKHIYDLYEKLGSEEWGHVNVGRTGYVLFSRSGNYTGLINLGDKPLSVSREELSRASGIADVSNLNAVVAHATETADSVTAEPHSISIFNVIK